MSIKSFALWSMQQLHEEVGQLSEKLNPDLLRPALRKRGFSIFTLPWMNGFLLPLTHDQLAELVIHLRKLARLQRRLEMEVDAYAQDSSGSKKSFNDLGWD